MAYYKRAFASDILHAKSCNFPGTIAELKDNKFTLLCRIYTTDGTTKTITSNTSSSLFSMKQTRRFFVSAFEHRYKLNTTYCLRPVRTD